MKYKHCCVVDADGAYKTFVLVLLEQGEDGETVERVQHYKLAEGEQLIDMNPPAMRPYAGAAGFIKPRWNLIEWTEAATDEEIAAWEVEHPASEVPEPREPSEDLEDRVTALEQAQTEIWSAQAAAIREGVNSVEW